MPPESRSSVPRRRFLAWWLGLPVLAGWLGNSVFGAGEKRLLTPEDDLGPFYPLDWQGEIDADLSRFGAASAEGERLQISGVVSDSAGRPLPDAVVEIWQADRRGRYRHPGVPEHLRDPGFQGYGRTLTDAAGAYRFVTVMPGRYGSRPPHVHFRVAQPGRPEFVTQMYFRGDNREGGPTGRRPAGREALTVDARPAADGRAARFDLVLAVGGG
jgi:protocatechuate 3,4-dioxygenase beta subunit